MKQHKFDEYIKQSAQKELETPDFLEWDNMDIPVPKKSWRPWMRPSVIALCVLSLSIIGVSLIYFNQQGNQSELNVFNENKTAQNSLYNTSNKSASDSKITEPIRDKIKTTRKKESNSKQNNNSKNPDAAIEKKSVKQSALKESRKQNSKTAVINTDDIFVSTKTMIAQNETLSEYPILNKTNVYNSVVTNKNINVSNEIDFVESEALNTIAGNPNTLSAIYKTDDVSVNQELLVNQDLLARQDDLVNLDVPAREDELDNQETVNQQVNLSRSDAIKTLKTIYPSSITVKNAEVNPSFVVQSNRPELPKLRAPEKNFSLFVSAGFINSTQLLANTADNSLQNNLSAAWGSHFNGGIEIKLPSNFFTQIGIHYTQLHSVFNYEKHLGIELNQDTGERVRLTRCIHQNNYTQMLGLRLAIGKEIKLFDKFSNAALIAVNPSYILQHEGKLLDQNSDIASVELNHLSSQINIPVSLNYRLTYAMNNSTQIYSEFGYQLSMNKVNYNLDKLYAYRDSGVLINLGLKRSF